MVAPGGPGPRATRRASPAGRMSMVKAPSTLETPTTHSPAERIGRHYRLRHGDGFFEIRDNASGDQVGLFTEDALPAAWDRFDELERERSTRGWAVRAWHVMLRRWDLTVGVVVCALLAAGLLLAIT